MSLHENHIRELETQITGAMKAYDAQGVAVSIFGKSDTYYENFFGCRDAERKLPIDENTIFGMASISKSFTCLSVMQLVERGVLDLDALVSTYIPHFSGKNQSGVRLSHLMTHSAGFFPEKRILMKDVAMSMGIWGSFSTEHDAAYNEALADEGIKILAGNLDSRTKLIGRPGELMSYSNDSYGLISDIVRRNGGCKTFAEYARKEIFSPLAMNRTTLEFEAPFKDANCSRLYIHRKGKLEQGDFYDNAGVMTGGGSIKSTVSDMKKYTRMYLNGGRVDSLPGARTLLGGYYLKEMSKPRQLFRFQQYYGYGLYTKFVGDVTVIGHAGNLTGVATMFQWSPELECGVLVFCNTSEFPSAAMADAAMQVALGESPAACTTRYVDMPWDTETIRSAVGSYLSVEEDRYELTYDNGKLKLTHNGKELSVRPVRKDMLLVEKPYSTSDILLCKNDHGEVWGIRAGGRIIAKSGR